jgi:hypothetical protein
MMRRKLFIENLPYKPEPERTQAEILLRRSNDKKRKVKPITLNKIWTEPKKQA